jgi:hypothetical protein
MVVADIEFTQGAFQSLDNPVVMVTQVEDAAIAVAVDQPFSIQVPNVNPLPFADDKVDPCLAVKFYLPAGQRGFNWL